MTITIRIPTKVGNKHTPPTVWKGQKKLGTLSDKPKVVNGKLHAGRYILAVRGMDRFGYSGIGPETLVFTNDLHGKPCMEVHHEGDFATYELWDDPVVWSDGPPHPDHLQLAVRIVATPGIKEPKDR
jgi:hypothetical protein